MQSVPSVIQNCTLDENTLSLAYIADNIENFAMRVSQS